MFETLKENKSQGPGEKPGELIKHGTEKWFEHFRLSFQECISTNKIPAEWKLSYPRNIYNTPNIFFDLNNKKKTAWDQEIQSMFVDLKSSIWWSHFKQNFGRC